MYKRWLIAVIVIALIIRIAFLLSFRSTLSLATSGYDPYALNIVEGEGYTRFDDRNADSELPPLYPFFLALVYYLLGRGPIQVALVQMMLDVVTICVIFLIASRISTPLTGVLSAAFYAPYPYLVFQNLTVNDTALFIFLLTCGIWLSYQANDMDRPWSAAGAGLAFGLASLTKPWALLILILISVWWVVRKRRRGLPLLLFATIASATVVTPWIIRNTRLHGAPAFISTNDGSNLYQGNNPCVIDYLTKGWDAQWVECLDQPNDELGDFELNAWYRQKAVHYLREHPEEWGRLLTVKVKSLWTPVLTPTSLPSGVADDGDLVALYHTPVFNIARRVHFLYFVPLLVLGMIGLLLALWRGVEVFPMVSVLLVLTCTYVAFHPSTRYRSPADPFVFIFAGHAVVEISRRLKSKVKWKLT